MIVLRGTFCSSLVEVAGETLESVQGAVRFFPIGWRPVQADGFQRTRRCHALLRVAASCRLVLRGEREVSNVQDRRETEVVERLRAT